MKFSNYLVEITGVSIYPILSLVLFVAFFSVVTISVLYMSKNKVNYLSKLPIDSQDNKI